jgi:hypothetical protein
METSKIRKRMSASALTDPKIIGPAILSAFAKLDPRTLIRNPVIFVLEVVTALTTVIFIRELIQSGGGEHPWFTFQIILLPRGAAKPRLPRCGASAPRRRPSSSPALVPQPTSSCRAPASRSAM